MSLDRKNFIRNLAEIQKKLKANKSQFNSFGKYSYRNAEDIQEAVKPFLGEMSLTLTEEVVQVGERIYFRATATITDGVDSQSSNAFAREPEEMKGMSLPQVSGATSSYAAKYALGKLFLLDDTKDADSMDNRETKTVSKQENKDEPEKPQVEAPKGRFSRRK